MAAISPTAAAMLASPFTSVQQHRSPFRAEQCVAKTVKTSVRCSRHTSIQSAAVATTAAALLLFSPSSEAALAELQSRPASLCEVAAAPDESTILNLDASSGGESGDGGPAVISSGMAMKNFDPVRYSGRWFEVASLKLGFAGQGQGDCHCTQGIYKYDEEKQAIEPHRLCHRNSGRVQCVTDKELTRLKISEFERMQMIRQKCYLRFPNLPFIPRQPYNVLATDYDNYALVSGAKDASFIQIYSRTPNPGREFIDAKKAVLGTLGYDAEDIKDTPQDCEETTLNELDSMVSDPGIEAAMDNTFQPIGLSKGVQLNPLTSSLETLKKLIQLYLPKFK